MLKGALEENVLTLLCWSEAHAHELVMRLTPDTFSTRAYKDIAKKAFEHLGHFGNPPRSHLRDLLEDKIRKGDDGKLLLQTIEAMETLNVDIQPEFVLDRLDKFIKLRQMTQAVEAAADALFNEDIVAAEEALHTPGIGHNSGTPGIFLHDSTAALAFLNEREEDYFPSGVGVLDDAGIRPERKTLTLVIAPAKRGKTWWLIEIGKQAMLTRKTVLHITLEMSEERISQRYIQSMYAMAADKTEAIRVPVFNRDENNRCIGIEFDIQTPEIVNVANRWKIAKKLEALKHRSRLLIKQFPSGTLTLGAYIAYLDHLERSEDFVPDMVILDYPDLMAIDANNIRTATGRMFSDIRGVAVARNHACVAATQGNRESSTARVVTSRNVAEDWSKIGTADTVLTYSQTGEERGMNLARILVSEARNAKDKFIVLVTQSYATGQFCLDSVYMNKYMEDEMKRLTGTSDKEDDD